MILTYKHKAYNTDYSTLLWVGELSYRNVGAEPCYLMTWIYKQKGEYYRVYRINGEYRMQILSELTVKHILKTKDPKRFYELFPVTKSMTKCAKCAKTTKNNTN